MRIIGHGVRSGLHGARDWPDGDLDDVMIGMRIAAVPVPVAGLAALRRRKAQAA